MRKIGMGTEKKKDTEAKLAALREENKALRTELDALRKEKQSGKAGKTPGEK